MKKLISICLILIITTGCSTSKLTCTSKTTDDLRTTETKFIITYKKNNVLTIKQSSQNTFKNKDSKKIYENFLNESYNEIKKEKNITIKKEDKDLIYNIIIEINTKKIDDKKIIELGLSKKIDEIKKIFTDKNITCE